MAVVLPEVLDPGVSLDFKDVHRVVWKNIKSGDTCAPAALARYTDRSIQIEGTFSGATVSIEGTLNTTYAKLRDGEGLDLIGISDSRIKYIQEPTAYVKPGITGGSGSTNLTIVLMATGRIA